MSALDSGHAFNFALMHAVGLGDLDTDSPVARGLNPGACVWTHTPWGMRLLRFVQNRHTAAVVKGALLSAVGDTDGKTQVAAAGAAGLNTTVKATVVGATADIHQGGGIYILNSTIGAGTPPEGEDSIVASNTTTTIYVEVGNPFSATITPTDTINLYGTYNSQLSAQGDQAYAVQGVVIGKNGISSGNFGFVARNGYTPNTLVVAATALTQNDPLIADVGRVGPALGTASVGGLHIGKAPHVVNADIVSDKTSVYLTLGPGFNPGTIDASA